MVADYYRSQLELIMMFVNIFSVKTFSELEEYFKLNDKEQKGKIRLKVFEDSFRESDGNHQAVDFFLRMCNAVNNGELNYK